MNLLHATMCRIRRRCAKAAGGVFARRLIALVDPGAGRFHRYLRDVRDKVAGSTTPFSAVINPSKDLCLTTEKPRTNDFLQTPHVPAMTAVALLQYTTSSGVGIFVLLQRKETD